MAAVLYYSLQLKVCIVARPAAVAATAAVTQPTTACAVQGKVPSSFQAPHISMGVRKKVPALQLLKAAAAGLACVPVVVRLYVGIKTRHRQHRLA
jgi:hypothetical protein